MDREEHPEPSTIEVRIAHMPDAPMRTLLFALLDGARGDEGKFRSDLAAVFDYGESLISMRFAEFVQRFLEIWALAVVVFLNVDTVDIAQNLWSQTGETAGEQVRAIPIGWGAADIDFTIGGIASKIVGLLLTVGAVSFGAEFWLGLLERLGRAPTTKS